MTQFDARPEEMDMYLSYYGPHFNKKLCKFAVSLMRKDGKKLEPFTKDNVNRMLDDYGIKLEHKDLYDPVFVANMTKADNYGGSIRSEQDVALRIKEYLDDEDGYDGIAFNRWLADMARKGITIDWEEMI